MLETNRYLTNKAKKRVLANFAKNKKTKIPDKYKGDTFDRGYPDPEILPWCDALNEIPGVCTIQSCSGHFIKRFKDGSKQMGPGHLWIWLSKPMSMKFHFYAREFGMNARTMERVRVLYSNWGQELVDVYFGGLERNSLYESASTIWIFLKFLSEETI